MDKGGILMIKMIIFNLSMQGFSMREIEKTTGLTAEQIKEILGEILNSYSGGMEIFKNKDNVTYIEKACMEAGNRLFKNVYQKEFEKCVSNGYPDGLAMIFTEGYMRGIIRAFEKGYSEWRIGWSVFSSEWVIRFAQGYTLSLFKMKESLRKSNHLAIKVSAILGIPDQKYKEIKDITIDDLQTKYGISE